MVFMLKYKEANGVLAKESEPTTEMTKQTPIKHAHEHQTGHLMKRNKQAFGLSVANSVFGHRYNVEDQSTMYRVVVGK